MENQPQNPECRNNPENKPMCNFLVIICVKKLDHFPTPKNKYLSRDNVVCTTNKASDQPAHTRSLIRAFASRLNIL